MGHFRLFLCTVACVVHRTIATAGTDSISTVVPTPISTLLESVLTLTVLSSKFSATDTVGFKATGSADCAAAVTGAVTLIAGSAAGTGAAATAAYTVKYTAGAVSAALVMCLKSGTTFHKQAVAGPVVAAATLATAVTSITEKVIGVASTALTILPAGLAGHLYFTLTGSCSGSSVVLASSAATWVPTVVGVYKVCHQSTSAGITMQASTVTVTVKALSSAAVVTGATGGATINVVSTITLAPATLSGKAIFVPATSGACPISGDLSLTVTAGVLTHTFTALGDWKICFQETGKFGILQTNALAKVTVVAATGAKVITVIAPVTMKAVMAGAAGTEITFTQTPAGGKVFLTTAATCDQQTPFVIATKKSTIALPAVGVYNLCYQAAGGSDSVKQDTTGLKLTVTGTATTAVTKIAPASISVGKASTILLTGAAIAAGDKVVFVKDVAGTTPTVCTEPTITITAAKNAELTATALTVGTYTVCYRGTGNFDSAQQVATPALNLTVVAATGLTVVTAITLNPTKPTSGTEVTVTMVGPPVNSMVAITNKTDCAAILPAAWKTVIAAKTVKFTPLSNGTHIMCYRAPGGNDAVKQTGITLSVLQKATQTSGVSRVQVSLLFGITFILGLGFGSPHCL